MAELDRERILREPTSSQKPVVQVCSGSHKTSEAEEYEAKRRRDVVDGDIELFRQQRITGADHGG